MSDEELAKLGAACRQAKSGNLITGSFAAHLVGESYPFSKEMSEIVFREFTDLELGRKFAEWTK